MKVTINQCRMLFRSPWRKAEPIDDYAETLQMENEDQVELFTLVMGLEKKYRVVIHLFYYEGYSVKEISELLKIPEKTVRTRLFRARAKLKNILTEEVSDND
jgi:RNA polymerase sigma-70 factor (ECF subfamily)